MTQGHGMDNIVHKHDADGFPFTQEPEEVEEAEEDKRQNIIGTTITIPGGGSTDPALGGGIRFAGQTGIVKAVTPGGITVSVGGQLVTLPRSDVVLTNSGNLVTVDADGFVTSKSAASAGDVRNFIEAGPNVNIGLPDAAPAGPAGPPQPVPLGPRDFAEAIIAKSTYENDIATNTFNADVAFAEFQADYNELVAQQDRFQKDLDLTAGIQEQEDLRLREIAESTRQVRVGEERGRRAVAIFDALKSSIPGAKGFNFGEGKNIPFPQFTFNQAFGGDAGLTNLTPVPGKSAITLPEGQLNPLAPRPDFPESPQFSPFPQQQLADIGFRF